MARVLGTAETVNGMDRLCKPLVPVTSQWVLRLFLISKRCLQFRLFYCSSVQSMLLSCSLLLTAFKPGYRCSGCTVSAS